MDTLELTRVVEFSELFPEEKEINVKDVLRTFDRHTLIKMSALLSLQYGNMSFPSHDYTLFSPTSEKHVDYLNKHFEAYFKRIKLARGQKVILVTFRTILELWRNIFSIKAEEYKSTIEQEDTEIILFKIILSLNEKIMRYKTEENPDTHNTKLEELIFLNSYLTNDCNLYNYNTIILPQIYYFQTLIDFIPRNNILNEAMNKLLDNWGISSWKEYFITIIYLSFETERYRKEQYKGIPIIKPKEIIENDSLGYFSETLINQLSIEEDEYIPYDEQNDPNNRNNNLDYRVFRAKPFVKLKDNQGYVIINNQLLCERLYNSLYFDLLPFINGKKGSIGLFDFNKAFVEKVLFRKTMFKCLNRPTHIFPALHQCTTKEDRDEPDFYARFNDNILLLECKAIKMNGKLRDDGDYKQMLEDLFQKIILKTRNLDPHRGQKDIKPEAIGMGQLVKHIDAIEEGNFIWDTDIPDAVAYYPLLVFEDMRLVQSGISKILNNHLSDLSCLYPKLDFNELAIKPVLTISISTLYLYADLIHRKGLLNLIDSFLEKNAIKDKFDNYILSPIANFDTYLRSYPLKHNPNIIKRIIKWIEEK